MGNGASDGAAVGAPVGPGVWDGVGGVFESDANDAIGSDRPGVSAGAGLAVAEHAATSSPTTRVAKRGGEETI